MKVGIDVLGTDLFRTLRGKRVGLLSHQAALTADGSTSAQLLHRVCDDGLVALFGPEHGFLGQAGAGDLTCTQCHPDWGIPIYSLYGEHRKPTSQMLANLDVVICDLQDLGVRCYTYLATLRNMLEACAEAGVEVIVTDRPIPLPNIVDGPLTDPLFSSFVAPCILPLAYGMTPAESASWMTRTLHLDLKLTTVLMQGWRRVNAVWDGTRPDFMPPSPGIKTWESAMTYAATVFTEALPGIDCGRGTNLAFRVLGAPWLHAESFCEHLKHHALEGVTFHPYRYVATTGSYIGRELDAIRLSVTDPFRFKPVKVSCLLLQQLTRVYGVARVWHHKGVRPAWFDALYGTTHVREQLIKNGSLKNLFAKWACSRQTFNATRAEALLYI